MIDQLPHGVAPRSDMATTAEQLCEPESADETLGDGVGDFVLDLAEMLPGAQDVMGIVEGLVGRFLLRHEAQVIRHVGEVFSGDPVEHVEDLRPLVGVFHRDGHAVTVLEHHVVIEGVLVDHPIVVRERQDGELGMKFPHIGAGLDDRRDTMFELALVEYHGAVEDRETARGLRLAKRRTPRRVSFGRIVPVKRDVAALAGVSAAAVFYSPLPRCGRA